MGGSVFPTAAEGRVLCCSGHLASQAASLDPEPLSAQARLPTAADILANC